jgi:hypothetical protein
VNIFLRFRKDYYYSLLKKKENGRKSIEKQKNNLGNSYNYDTTFLCFLFLSVSADFRRTSCFWDSKSMSRILTHPQEERNRDGEWWMKFHLLGPGEIRSIACSRWTVMMIWWIGKKTFLCISILVVVGRQDQLTWTKWWRNKFQSTPSFLMCTYQSNCVWSIRYYVAHVNLIWIFISFHEPFDYLIVWLLVCRYGAP